MTVLIRACPLCGRRLEKPEPWTETRCECGWVWL